MTDRAELIARLENIAAGMAQCDWGTDVDMVKEAIAILEAKPEPVKPAPKLPRLNIRCETSLNMPDLPPAKGTTNLNVIRVEVEDDESYTAVTDYWPSECLRQHHAELELLRSKLALVLRENRRLSDELKEADIELAAKDSEIAELLTAVNDLTAALNATQAELAAAKEQGRREAFSQCVSIANDVAAYCAGMYDRDGSGAASGIAAKIESARDAQEKT